MLISFLLLYASIRITCINIRNGAKMELNNLSGCLLYTSIFTSHNTNLLDLDVLRRDQIWFTEKDEQTAATDLFSLYDFSIRKDAKVEKGYLIGRYGAIPFIKGGL